MDSVIIANPYLLITLFAVLCLWIYAAAKRSAVLSAVSFVLLSAALIICALTGASYEELTVVILAFTLSGVLLYTKKERDGK